MAPKPKNVNNSNGKFGDYFYLNLMKNVESLICRNTLKFKNKLKNKFEMSYK